MRICYIFAVNYHILRPFPRSLTEVVLMGLSVKFDFERGSGAGFESGAFREDFFELFSVVYIS